jgi:hypothetical protein
MRRYKALQRALQGVTNEGMRAGKLRLRLRRRGFEACPQACASGGDVSNIMPLSDGA